MEVETHIITAAAATVENLRQSVGAAGVEVAQFVLNPLASAEVVLTDTERQMGCIVCDIGGGTTDLAVYVDGDVWHTMVMAVGGNHITQDIAHGLRLPLNLAEEVKKQHGYATQTGVGLEEVFSVRPFGEDKPLSFQRKDLAHIIEARIEEVFGFVLQEVKRSGYDGLLPAGMILTGGVSALPGIRQLASRVLNMPVRVAQPEGLMGLADQLNSPAYSTSVGLLHWAMAMQEMGPQVDGSTKRVRARQKNESKTWNVKDLIKRILP
jgi:cell division protein FtsA